MRKTSRRPLIFDNASTAIATARRIASARHEVIASQHGPASFRVYVDRETYSVTGSVVWTNLWDMKATA